mmetsp:Transcript_21008/g.44755  ORF Transcript_21008/g.44755 Transcript_21008/m.44755 type:complete len:289 (-) Transcript_21008:68-934(-)
MGLGDEQLVNPCSISPTLRCAICFEVFDDPVFFSGRPCQHVFCRTCIVPALERRAKCPICRSRPALCSRLQPHLAIRNLLDEIVVRCGHGCSWTGRKDSLQAHMADCPLQQLAKLEAEKAEREIQLVQRDELVFTLEKQVAEQEEFIALQRARVTEREREIAERDDLIATLEKRVSQRDVVFSQHVEMVDRSVQTEPPCKASGRDVLSVQWTPRVSMRTTPETPRGDGDEECGLEDICLVEQVTRSVGPSSDERRESELDTRGRGVRTRTPRRRGFDGHSRPWVTYWK